MSWVTLSNKVVKTRKDHVCIGCGNKYPVGTMMNKNVSVDDGNLSSTHMCLICEEFMSDKWRYCDGEISQGDVWEYREYEEFRNKKLQDAKENRYSEEKANQEETNDSGTEETTE